MAWLQGDHSDQDSWRSGYFGAYSLAVWKGRLLAQNHSLSGYLVCWWSDFVPGKRALSFQPCRICLHGPLVSSEHLSYLLSFVILLSQSLNEDYSPAQCSEMSPESSESGRAGRPHQIFTTSLWKLLLLELQTFSLKLWHFQFGLPADSSKASA